MAKIVPSLWYSEKAEEAAAFYVSLLPNSRIDSVTNLPAEGGVIEQCGWLKDRYGVSWQIVPTILGEMMKHKDRQRAKRVAEAILGMVKFDIAGLKKAYDGGVAA